MAGRLFPDGGRGLPRVAYGDPAAGAHMLVDDLPHMIAGAETLGVVEVADHLRMALAVAERGANEGAERHGEKAL